MGNLLRRYWTPACLSMELEADGSPLEVRLLGEDLVAFRDTSGKAALFDRNCPASWCSVFYGRNEDCGLRCAYHGWKFDVTGQCVDMPSDRGRSPERIKIPSYPVYESGGIVWTYMARRSRSRRFGTSAPRISLRIRSWRSKVFWDCNWIAVARGKRRHRPYLTPASVLQRDGRR